MNNNGNGTNNLYGMMAEFNDPEHLVEAVEQARAAGYKNVEAYTPFYVEGLSEALGEPPSILPYVLPMGLAAGAFIGYMLQYWTSTAVYQFNVGGRPLVSWPAFIPVTFEVAILVAALSVVLIMFARNGLPLPYHPVFNTENFEVASRSGFFLCIAEEDARFSRENTLSFLQGLGPVNVSEVQI